jgi:hypothetical protein
VSEYDTVKTFLQHTLINLSALLIALCFLLMNKYHVVHSFAFQHTAIRLSLQLTAGHDFLCFLATKFSISFYGRFVTVDAHFACMDGVHLDFLFFDS